MAHTQHYHIIIISSLYIYCYSVVTALASVGRRYNNIVRESCSPRERRSALYTSVWRRRQTEGLRSFENFVSPYIGTLVLSDRLTVYMRTDIYKSGFVAPHRMSPKATGWSESRRGEPLYEDIFPKGKNKNK